MINITMIVIPTNIIANDNTKKANKQIRSNIYVFSCGCYCFIGFIHFHIVNSLCCFDIFHHYHFCVLYFVALCHSLFALASFSFYTCHLVLCVTSMFRCNVYPIYMYVFIVGYFLCHRFYRYFLAFPLQFLCDCVLITLISISVLLFNFNTPCIFVNCCIFICCHLLSSFVFHISLLFVSLCVGFVSVCIMCTALCSFLLPSSNFVSVCCFHCFVFM